MAYIVENKVNFLTFPPVAKSIVIWGKGYGVASIKDSELLKSTELIYWGDLDAQGFEILSQFRSYFARVKSLLMDKATFDKYFENDLGTPSKINAKLNLTTEEEELYSYIKTNNYRLEQEKIPQSYVVEKLKCRFVWHQKNRLPQFGIKIGKDIKLHRPKSSFAHKKHTNVSQSAPRCYQYYIILSK